MPAPVRIEEYSCMGAARRQQINVETLVELVPKSE
jgi:hypothetical protein